MRRSIHFLFAILVFTTFACKQKSPYDNSTPEKLMLSLATVIDQPRDQNPIPFFYTKTSATAINKFDEAGEKALAAFEGFKTAMTEKFPENVKRVQKNKIELQTEGGGYSTRSFNLSASLIRKQIQENAPEAYEYVAASAPDENGIVTIEYNMLGSKKEMKTIKEDGQYVMFVPEEGITQLEGMAAFFVEADALLSSFIKDIEDATINTENFMDMSSEWHNEYLALLKMLN